MHPPLKNTRFHFTPSSAQKPRCIPNQLCVCYTYGLIDDSDDNVSADQETRIGVYPPPLSDLNTHLQGRIFTSPLPYTQLEMTTTKVVANGMQILKNFIAVAFANNEPLPL